MADEELKDMDQLGDGVTFFDDDLLGPVGQHRVAVFHAQRHGRSQDLQRLSHNVARFHRMGLQKTVEHLSTSMTCYINIIPLLMIELKLIQ